MMNMDRFLDTKDKRQHMIHLLVLLFMCWMAFIYIQSAMTLLSLETYDHMYNALTTSSLDGCYAARFILRSMSMSDLQMGTILANLMLSSHMVDILFVCLCVLVCIDRLFQPIRKMLLCIPILYILQFIFVVIIALIASSMDSLQGVINCVRGIGGGMLIFQIMMIVLLLLQIMKTLKAYVDALQFIAIEIQED